MVWSGTVESGRFVVRGKLTFTNGTLMPPLNPQVTIQESTLAAMACDQRFLVEFPFLSELKRAPRKRGCGGCGAKAGVRSDVYQTVKAKLATMDSTRKQTLKRLLNTKGVRIVFRDAKNQTIQLTF